MTVLYSIHNEETGLTLSIQDGLLNDAQDEVTIKVGDNAVFTMTYEDAVRMAEGIMRAVTHKMPNRSKRIQCVSCGNAVILNNRVRIADNGYVCPACKNVIPLVSYPSYKGVIRWTERTSP